MAKRLLFYDDAPNFGGHEMMTLRLLEQLAGNHDYDITFVASVANTKLRAELGFIAPPVKVRLTSYSSGRGQWLRTYLSIGPLLRLRRLIEVVKPDMVIVIQGGISLSSLGLLAGRLARVRTISYIPMTHDESLFSPSPVRAGLRQLFVDPLYRLPHCLVTISQRMAGYAAGRRRGAVRVVENGIALSLLKPENRYAVRSALGLRDDDRLLLMVGRIEFWQKRHDLAVEALSIARARGARLHLLVVGDGPDEQALRTLVFRLGLGEFVHWHAWQSDVTPFYAACDVLLLPSRYEGVPLVMLEAMHARRKVMAANVDGMADMLPPNWTFASGNVRALADLLSAPDDAGDVGHVLRHHELIATQHTIAAFVRRFLCIIDEEVKLSHA